MSFGKPRVPAGHVQEYATGGLFTPGETIGGILHCRARQGGHFDHLVPPGHAGRHGGADGVFTVPRRARRDCTLVLHGRSSGTQIEGRFSVSH